MSQDPNPPLAPLPIPEKRPRFPLGKACAVSCIPGLVAAGVVMWMAATHHAHLNIPLIRNVHDWIYWPIATVAWFIAASGIPLMLSFLLWVASHLTPQP